MSDVSIKVHSGGCDGEVVVDGHDIARAVTGFALHHELGGTPRLELELRVNDVTTFGSPHVQVHLDSMTAAYLERAGWTPPPGVESALHRDEHGCPCEWVDVSTAVADPDSPETLLGRTVPTCPVHGSAS